MNVLGIYLTNVIYLIVFFIALDINVIMIQRTVREEKEVGGRN